MSALPSPRTWLLLASGSDRGHGGNSGYNDEHDSHYEWDSTVPNHKQLRVGDIVAVWDRVELLGTAVIEEIHSEPGFKELRRCPAPACGTTRIALRKRLRPRYRCMKCHVEFDTPSPDVIEVTRYRARYDAAWTPLEGLLTGPELRSTQVHTGDFNSMRPLDWTAFSAKLAEHSAHRAVERVGRRAFDAAWPASSAPGIEFTNGFRETFVRIRRGQASFRSHLLQAQGAVCAMTGTAPRQALEAGHLYSFARLGVHYEHGGLLLRRDIHRLFDDGLLAVEPGALRISVDSNLKLYPQYARLHGEALRVTLRDQQVEWLAKHWAEHRDSREARA